MSNMSPSTAICGRFAMHGDYVPRERYRTDFVATAVLPTQGGRTAPRFGIVARGDVAKLDIAIAGRVASTCAGDVHAARRTRSALASACEGARAGSVAAQRRRTERDAARHRAARRWPGWKRDDPGVGAPGRSARGDPAFEGAARRQGAHRRAAHHRCARRTHALAGLRRLARSESSTAAFRDQCARIALGRHAGCAGGGGRCGLRRRWQTGRVGGKGRRPFPPREPARDVASSMHAATRCTRSSTRCRRACRPARWMRRATCVGRRHSRGSSMRRWRGSIPAISCRRFPGVFRAA